MFRDDIVNVRYLVDDVEASIEFYTGLLGFEVLGSFAPAFADVQRGNLRLLLSGPKSSAGRPMADGATPGPGGWNRIHLLVEDIGREVEQLREAGATFRNEIVVGPGGKQVLVQDPSGNYVELFEPAAALIGGPRPKAALGDAGARGHAGARSVPPSTDLDTSLSGRARSPAVRASSGGITAGPPSASRTAPDHEHTAAIR